MNPAFVTLSLLALAGSCTQLSAEPHQLKGKNLQVTVDPSFPRVIEYRLGAAQLAGQPTATEAVELNGKPTNCTVQFQAIDESSAEYRLSFPQEKIATTLKLSVEDEALLMQMKDPEEHGSVRLMTLSFPGNALVSLSSVKPAATLAAARFEGYGHFKQSLDTLALLPITPQEESGNVLIVADGDLSAALFGNHLLDVQRVAWTISDENGIKSLHARRPIWQFRELEDRWLEIMPQQRVAITGDRNQDGTTDWQDGALLQRELHDRPFGAELVKKGVADQVAMNFASLTQQPFLRILDNVKRTYLATDGLTHHINVKGFTAEGHDSANTDYGGNINPRAGGLSELQFLEKRAKDFNTRIGVHINATEAYPEAKRYKPEILIQDDQGNFRGGWAWLDHSHHIDKLKDTLSGELFSSLELMKKEQPDLSFVYLDVYGESGWVGWQLAKKINELGWPLHTEYSTAMDPWSVWAHHRADVGPIVRFLWNADRDLYGHDSLLRGADHTGFLGWQGQRDLYGFLRITFGRNLPTKFLQHYDLLRWEHGKEAVFAGGLRVSQNGKDVTVALQGKELMSWKADGSQNRLFVPWDPLDPEKIYVWDEVGGDMIRQLPSSWQNLTEVTMYPLSLDGRGEPIQLPVADHQVTLNVPKNVAHVIYREPVADQAKIVWGEGGPIADPGFNGTLNDSWTLQGDSGGAEVKIAEMATGDRVLAVSGAATAPVGVQQTIRGLTPGQTYAASVWVQIKGKRKAVISVTAEGATSQSNYVEQTRVRNRNDSDAKIGTFFQRLRVDFTVPQGKDSVSLALLADADPSGALIEFDDVRMVPIGRSPQASQHTYFEGFEHVDQGWGPFVYATQGQTQTHLSETNAPYTQDTIDGKYSFKTREEPAGIVVRTLPSHLRLKPATRYRIAVDTIAASNIYELTVRSRAGSEAGLLWKEPIPKGRGRVQGEFITSRSTECFLALEKTAKGGGMCVLDNIAIDELGAAPTHQIPADPEVGDLPENAQLLWHEDFASKLGSRWKTTVSENSGTALTAANGSLTIQAAANTSAVAQHPLPRGTNAVMVTLNARGAVGETWGPGLALGWSDGSIVRINLRSEKRFGIDATGKDQQITGAVELGVDTSLRIRLTKNTMVFEARAENEDSAWQGVATLPRSGFDGSPAWVQLGKSHEVSGTDDHSSVGEPGTVQYQNLRAFGNQS